MFFTLALFIVQGGSMAHLGYYEDKLIKTIPAPCPVESVIAFHFEDEDYIKTLKAYTGRGDIWVEGRDGVWTDKGKEVQSYDSRIYGYIPFDQHCIIGCIY